jgi:DNA-binding response OmpR family regulator
MLQATAPTFRESGRSLSLQDENETLRERVRQLEEAFGIYLIAPSQFRFGPSETKLFGMLMRRAIVATESMMVVLFPAVSDDIARVHIYNMRRKLKPFDMAIKSVRSQGYFLSPETKAKVRALIEAETA